MATNADVDSASGRLPANQENQETSAGLEPAPESPNADQTKSSDGSSHKDALDDSEFTIAADLTLYANPLRVLQKTSKSAAHNESQSSATSEMIAADLVKYGSPLDDKPN